MNNELTPVGAVIYTDGSARPNPGYYGAGVHGYTYVYPDEKRKASKVLAWVATDKGYVLQKDLEQSDAKPVHIVNYLDAYRSFQTEGTNNLGELVAPSVFFQEFREISDVISKLHVISDSEYMLDGIQKRVYAWIRNGWMTAQNTRVKNWEIWEMLFGYVEKFKSKGELTWAWVMGHNDDFGNVKADYLAGIGRNKSAEGGSENYAKISDPLGYHKVNVEIHPLISLKRIYFNTDPEFNSKGLYYQTGWSGQNFIVGKRTPEAVFSVVKLSEPDQALEAVFDAQYQLQNEVNSLVYVKTERVRSADVYPYLIEHGGSCLTKDKRNLNLNFMDRKPVTVEVLPGELPLRAVDVLNHLEEILVKYEEGTLTGDSVYSLHDVTDHFYERSTKSVGKKTVEKTELRKEFKVGIKKTDVKVVENLNGKETELKLPLMFQDDIPSRNTLKNLETESPKVFIVVWKESSHLLRYSTIIQTKTALGIWSNFFANQLLF